MFRTVQENALGVSRSKINNRRRILDRANERLEHQVEKARLAEGALHSARWALRVRRTGSAFDPWIISAKTLFAISTVDEGVHKTANVAARFPDLRIHQDCGIQSFDVVSRAHHRVPPPILEILLDLDTEWSIIPHRAGAAIDL